MKKRLFDDEEIAEYLGVTVDAVYTWVSEREIPHVKIGQLTKFDLGQIEQWILENSVGVAVKTGEKHIDEETVEKVVGGEPGKKICGKCGEKKRLDLFYKEKRCKDGRVAKCKACMKEEGHVRWQRLKEEKKKKQEKVPWSIGGKFEQRNAKNKIIFKDGVTYGKEGEEWLARKREKYAKRNEE